MWRIVTWEYIPQPGHIVRFRKDSGQEWRVATYIPQWLDESSSTGVGGCVWSDSSEVPLTDTEVLSGDWELLDVGAPSA